MYCGNLKAMWMQNTGMWKITSYFTGPQGPYGRERVNSYHITHDLVSTTYSELQSKKNIPDLIEKISWLSNSEISSNVSIFIKGQRIYKVCDQLINNNMTFLKFTSMQYRPLTREVVQLKITYTKTLLNCLTKLRLKIQQFVSLVKGTQSG